MTTATTTVPAAEDRPSAAEQAFLPYAQLARMLVPSSGSVSVYQANGELRWSSVGYERPDLREIVDGLTSAGPSRARASIRSTSSGATAFGARLDDGDGEPLGYLVIELRTERSQNPSLATNLLNPLVECLGARLRAEAGAAEGRSSRLDDEELGLLIDVSEIGESGPGALRRLLERSIRALDCEAAAFVSPDRALSVIVEREQSVPTANEDVVERTRRHLLAWAQLNNRPMVVNRVGEAAPFKILSCPVRAESAELSGLIALFRTSAGQNFERRDVHLLEFLCRRALRLVNVDSSDPLTGLRRREAFETAIAATGEAAGRVRRGALLTIHVDRLQAVNDAFGLDAGDQVIREVTAGLLAAAPDEAIASRLSGDRFALFVTDGDEAAAIAVAGRLLDEVAGRSVRRGDETVPLSVSIGIAIGSDALASPRDLIAAAGVAAIESRRNGGNRYSSSRGAESRSPSEARELVAAARLRRALDASQFRLLAQRIVGLEDPAKTVGYEVLIRLADETGTLLAPDRFMAVAHRYGLALGVDTWVFAELLRRIEGHGDTLAGLPVGIAVNVSEQSLLSPSYAQTIATGIAACGLPGTLFSFEIAEAAAVGHADAARAFIERVRDTGARVALDNFGNGLTSFARLRELDVDYLKVAGELIRGMADRHLESMVFGLAKAAESLGLPTVAEQVENETVAAKLAAMGVAYGQGFCFGRPAGIETLSGQCMQPEDL